MTFLRINDRFVLELLVSIGSESIDEWLSRSSLTTHLPLCLFSLLCCIGAGAIAKGSAALLAQAGHDPMIWSPSGASFPDSADATTIIIKATGAMDFECSTRIATSSKALVEKNDVILFALPANGHKQVFDELASWIRNGQHIIISSHSSLGALYLSQLLQERKVLNVPITAWGTTLCTARSSGDSHRSSVLINTIRQNVDTCTIPSKVQPEATRLCSRLFGDRIEFRPRDGLLAISLSNLNPQNHLGIALGNISRMEKGEEWYQVRYCWRMARMEMKIMYFTFKC
jgi:opine dehydrogenase